MRCRSNAVAILWRRRFIIALAVPLLGACSLGSDTASAAEVRPYVSSACGVADRNLVALAATDSSETSLDEAGSILLDFVTELPLVETEYGTVDSHLGNEVRSIRQSLHEISSAYDRRSNDLDPNEQDWLRDHFRATNAAAADFDVDECLSTAAENVLLSQYDGLQSFVSSIEPTGDFDTDIAAACSRFRVDSAQALADSLSEPNGTLLVFKRQRDLLDRFASDIGRFDPSEGLAEDFERLLSATHRYRFTVSDVESARLVSQSSLDIAIERYTAAETEFERLLEIVSPGC